MEKRNEREKMSYNVLSNRIAKTTLVAALLFTGFTSANSIGSPNNGIAEKITGFSYASAATAESEKKADLNLAFYGSLSYGTHERGFQFERVEGATSYDLYLEGTLKSNIAATIQPIQYFTGDFSLKDELQVKVVAKDAKGTTIAYDEKKVTTRKNYLNFPIVKSTSELDLAYESSQSSITYKYNALPQAEIDEVNRYIDENPDVYVYRVYKFVQGANWEGMIVQSLSEMIVISDKPVSLINESYHPYMDQFYNSNYSFIRFANDASIKKINMADVSETEHIIGRFALDRYNHFEMSAPAKEVNAIALSTPIATLSTEKETIENILVDATFDERAHRNLYRFNGGEWMNYEGSVTVTQNGLIEFKSISNIGKESVVFSKEIKNKLDEKTMGEKEIGELTAGDKIFFSDREWTVLDPETGLLAGSEETIPVPFNQSFNYLNSDYLNTFSDAEKELMLDKDWYSYDFMNYRDYLTGTFKMGFINKTEADKYFNLIKGDGLTYWLNSSATIFPSGGARQVTYTVNAGSEMAYVEDAYNPRPIKPFVYLSTSQKIKDGKVMVSETPQNIEQILQAVELAENSKLQADLDSARVLVDEMPTGETKVDLTNRLDKLQEAIDASEAAYQEMKEELADMKAYLLTGEGSKSDVLAMKEALEDISTDATLLLNKAHQDDIVRYVKDVQDIIGLLEVIWNKIASGEIVGLEELVSQLPESELKDNTQELVAEAKESAEAIALAEQIAIATKSVVKAEVSTVQADVTAALTLVNVLPSGVEKTSLTDRLHVVQKVIDDAKLVADQIAKATASVRKAEGSKVQADIDAARLLVEALPEVSEKTNLTQRLNTIVITPEGAELLKEAQEAVDKLNVLSTKEQIATAKGLVAKLANSSTKTELNDRIAEIELIQKATNAVGQAEKMQTNYNITLAEKAINQLPDGQLKTELAERIQQLKLTLEAESKVKSAELTKRDPYITDATESINKLNDSPKKTELTNRMKVIQDALAGETEATLLEEATAHVVLAEQHKRDPYLTSAKDLVSKLIDGTDKTALEARLKAIQDAAPVVPEAPEVDPALLKAAETQVSYAERYKRDPYLTRAQEAVDKLPVSEVKTAMQERLNVLTNEASDQVEANKLKTATDAVAKAESTSDLFVMKEARSLVNGLNDGKAKQSLVERLDAIEVTEAMQFAYDLKVEIDAIPDVTIKKALQEAYTAVGVAKDRQTSTYITKASKAIEALSKYEDTHSKVIEKLSTFFTDMQKELEIQKLVAAADNAVALAEKYQRAAYFAKAQSAIDGLPDGKPKVDMQARLDVVIK
ncbi:hypothetical protein [Psychrobacillus sp. FSL H8-0510]|uniref:hypothetical protein n=1 Tax=Psychrobacillus sp. FSL H8-0510 TaxID=2921394 RepID=UPI0030F8DD91